MTTNAKTYVNAVLFSPDGTTFAVGGNNGVLSLWDRDTASIQRRLGSHETHVTTLSFSQDSKLLLSGDESGLSVLWDLSTGNILQKIVHAYGPVFCAYFLNENSKIVLSVDNRIQLYNSDDYKLIKETQEYYTPLHSSMLKNGDFIISDGGGSIYLQSKNFDFNKLIVDSLDVVKYLLVDNTDRQCFIWTGDDILVVNLENLEFVKSFGERASDIGLALTGVQSPDGTYLATCGAEGMVWLFDVQTEKMVRVFNGHTDLVTSIDFSPDGKYLLTGSYDSTVRIWEVTTGFEVKRIEL